jgi:hypothetical protein
MSCCEQEEETSKRSITFSLHISTQEGFSVKGELQMEAIQIPPRASRKTVEPMQYDDVDADKRAPKSALRHQRPTPITESLEIPQYRFMGFRRSFLCVVLALLCTAFVIDMGSVGWNVVSQKLQYGSYPTVQMDVNLGHGGISHLTAYTYGNKIIFIELVGSKSTPYTFNLSEKLDSPRLVSITIADVNLDHKPDVLLHVDGLTQSIIFDNTGTGLVLSVAR